MAKTVWHAPPIVYGAKEIPSNTVTPVSETTISLMIIQSAKRSGVFLVCVNKLAIRGNACHRHLAPSTITMSFQRVLLLQGIILGLIQREISPEQDLTIMSLIGLIATFVTPATSTVILVMRRIRQIA